MDVLCDAPPPAPAPFPFAKREATAEAEADAQVLGFPAHAVATSVKSTVKHSCREVSFVPELQQRFFEDFGGGPLILDP